MTPKIYKNNEKWYNINNSGFAALISVLVVAAVGLGIVLTLLSQGMTTIATAGDLVGSLKARGYAVSCAEDALANATGENSLPWTGEISFDGGSCSYTVQDGGSENTMNIEAAALGMIKKIKIGFSANSSTVTINSWKEIPDFQ